MTMVTQPGFYGGQFKKAGQAHDGPTDQPEKAPVLSKMSKDELIAEAKNRNVTIDANATKADIIKALEA